MDTCQQIPHIIGVCLTVIVMLAAGVYCAHSIVNDMATNHIIRYFNHYKSIAKIHGFELELRPSYLYEPSPCDARYKLEGRTFRVVYGPWKTLRTLRKIKAGEFPRAQLEAESEYPHSELP